MALVKLHEFGVTHLPNRSELSESNNTVEVYHLVNCCYELMSANERCHFAIAPMGVELGIWQGRYEEMELPELRWWDNQDMSGVLSQ